MLRKRIATQGLLGAALLWLCAGTGLAWAQGRPLGAVQVRRMASPPAPAGKAADPMAIFAGLSYTEDQKAKVQRIHQDIKSRMDAVAKDDKLSSEARDGMLQGYQRMERSQIYHALTPEQQAEVRRRVLAERKAAREDQERERSSSPG